MTNMKRRKIEKEREVWVCAKLCQSECRRVKVISARRCLQCKRAHASWTNHDWQMLAVYCINNRFRHHACCKFLLQLLDHWHIIRHIISYDVFKKNISRYYQKPNEHCKFKISFSGYEYKNQTISLFVIFIIVCLLQLTFLQ